VPARRLLTLCLRLQVQLILHDVQAALSQELSSFGLFGRLHAADAGSSRELVNVATDFECVAADSTPGLLGAIEQSDGNRKTASIVGLLANEHANCEPRHVGDTSLYAGVAVRENIAAPKYVR